ncbi:unnamed protein product [Cuscuta europaea]|uniref:Agenet domain-containing protein n=1 Tax=Cuscuta europaea TaxID=41803 RepID=A0A9P1E3H3_CUSEU|nr:unnamed protein product [Cuscuta europaea]
MKFKKGVKVEVMNQSEVPISWRVAEILSGDGHTYVLRFDSLGESESPVQRVHRSLIRPSPPLGQHTERWLPGDILEVFDDCSWKVAIIVQTLKEDYYFVRFVGSSHEFCIHISSMRRRLAWQDGRWNWVPKVPTECGKVKSHELSNPVCYRNTRFPVPQPDSLDKFQGDTGEESHILPSRSRKRAFLHCSSTTESHTAHSQDLLALETNSSKQTVVQETLLEKGQQVEP